MNLILVIGLIVTMAFNAEAAPFCWNTVTGASADATSTNTHCQYTHAFGTYGSFRRLMWPTTTYAAAASSNCPASATCIAAVASSPTVTAALVSNLPAVSSCYTGTYSSTTLASQTIATCTTSVYCIATFAAATTIGTTSVSSSVTSACSNLVCAPAADKLCSLVANTNQVLGCYVGVYYQSTSTTTMTASICAPIASGATFVSASYCVSTFAWSSSNGYTITGSCATTCAAEAILATGTVATRGTVCSDSIYGNPTSYSSDSVRVVTYSLFAMLLPILLGFLF